jgi:hypothetical protein
MSWSSNKQATTAASTMDAGGVPGVWGCCVGGDVIVQGTWGDGLAFVRLLVEWACGTQV